VKIEGIPHVVVGTEAEPHSHPWSLSLRTFLGHQCGASLLRVPCMSTGSIIVLTAAHCVDNYYTSGTGSGFKGLTVKAGEHKIAKKEKGEEIRRVVKAQSHKFNRDTAYDNDIAVLKLDRPIEFSESIQGIELPKNKDGSFDSCTIAGWGATSLTNKANVLRELNVTVNRSPCETEDYKRKMKEEGDSDFEYEYKDDIMMCADRKPSGSSNTSGTFCDGDSGSPLACRQGEHIVQEGVASSTTKLCDGPTIFTRVSAYVPWIKEQVTALLLSDLKKKCYDN